MSSSTKPDIVIIANNIGELGGVQRVAHVLAQGLAQRDYNVQLIGVEKADYVHDYVANPLYEKHELNVGAPDSEYAAARLAQLLADRRPGIIIAMQMYSLRHVWLADVPDWRVVAQYHTTLLGLQGKKEQPRVTKLSRDADVLLLLTHEDADAFRKAGLNNTAVMRNPTSMYPEVVATERDRSVIWFGRLHEEKSVDRLLHAWRHVVDIRGDWRLRIFGHGPEDDALKRLCSELELDDYVDWMEPTPEVERELLTAGIFALTSQYEGLPMTLIEAMACGLPCVSFDSSPGIRSLIDDGTTGLLVRRNDVKGLAHSLLRLMGDPDERRRLGLAAHGAAKHFAVAEVLDDWESLFVDVMR